MSRSSAWIAGIAGVALTTFIVVGNLVEPFYPTGLEAVLGSVGGTIMAVDFAVLLVLVGAWVYHQERDKRRGLLLAVLVVVLGTPVALFYVAAFIRRTHLRRDRAAPAADAAPPERS
jgi:hypothetical protein